MVGRILQRNYVRKWLIRYHKWLESSRYIWCYRARSSGLQSIGPFEDISPLVTEHDESELFLPATINQLTDELRENFVNVPLIKKILNGNKVTTTIMLILNVTSLMTKLWMINELITQTLHYNLFSFTKHMIHIFL